ncbi:YdeI/OmpD-associated family protein [Rhodonellum sp.]|uniref:YdeI/OmpD-associated family protein n=1 Tax=Rhodonellum sp. TaxID=2231180 RepID=UPI00271DCB59|nr:YdeI/OmpD-associated family protein [Rhodonellum sp.]MDO9553238.1 YdeI/OmpD-associated family protein [Rhodonellum sp.]
MAAVAVNVGQKKPPDLAYPTMEIFSTSLQKFDSNLWQYHFPVPDAIALRLIEGENKRIICKINDQVTFQAALMKSESYWFVLVNKKHREELNLMNDQIIKISLVKDLSEYGHEMPEEFQVLLDQDDEGNFYFRALTKGKQRSLVYLVSKLKTSNSRLIKALAIVHHLKEVKGKLDFKLLNEKIKLYNQQNR